MEVIALTQGTDFTIWSLFVRAGIVVKCVMLLLLFSSIWSWAIMIQKKLSFRHVRLDTAKFDQAFWSGEPLDEFYGRIYQRPQGSLQRIFCAAMNEWKYSQRSDGELIAGARLRIERSMYAAVTREVNKLTNGLDFLATVGATAPFVGVFGTVWGIMTVFRDIGIQENTNLAVVAPGIGEALVATALGLFAAIPALIFFNNLSAAAERLSAHFEDFADEFSTIISRQLDE